MITGRASWAESMEAAFRLAEVWGLRYRIYGVHSETWGWVYMCLPLPAPLPYVTVTS